MSTMTWRTVCPATGWPFRDDYQRHVCDWLRRHGFDPNRVIVGYPIEVNDQLRQVRATTVPPNYAELSRTEFEASIQARIVQLESPAAPFPDPRSKQ